jgi:hypothetical protein
MTYRTSGGRHRLLIGPTTGAFAGQKAMRRYQVLIHSAHRPASIFVDGRRAADWHWQAQDSTASVTLPAASIRRARTVTW